MMGSRNSTRTSHRREKPLLPCFSPSTRLTEDDIERILVLKIEDFLYDDKALKSFNSYLRNKLSGDPPEVKQLLDVHDRVRELLKENRIVTDDEIEELSDLGLPYDKEKRLSRARSVDSTNHCLCAIQEECQKKIESDPTYLQFKQALLKKVGKTKNK